MIEAQVQLLHTLKMPYARVVQKGKNVCVRFTDV